MVVNEGGKGLAMKDTAIEWADNTINFHVGCTKVSEGCANCYMFRLEKRFGRDPTAVRKTNWTTIERNLKKWKPSRIFVNSMSDTFHESIGNGEILKMFDLMEKYNQHQYLILTKRIERAEEFFNKYFVIVSDHIWIGTSIESNKQVSRLEALGEIKAKTKFVSFEPLLGFVNIKQINCFDWAIVGGESGYQPREMKFEWADDLIDQLREMNIPIFFKQWGGTKKCKCHGAWGCRLYDHETLDEMPLTTLEAKG